MAQPTVRAPEMAGETFALPAPDFVLALALTPNISQTVSIPEKATYALFSATNNIHVRFGNNVAVPIASITDGTAGELNPSLRHCAEHAELSIVAETDCTATVAFYA